MILPLVLHAQLAVSTWGVDQQSSMWNSHETILTQASIRAKGLIRQPQIPVVGDARGMEAQPLIAKGVRVTTPAPETVYHAGHGASYANTIVMASLEDVMILPSEANIVRGVEPDGTAIWQITLGTPIKSTPQIDSHSINDHVGCMSTGVIVGTVWYGVCWISQDGSGNPSSGQYEMFGLNVADGTQAFAPVNLQTSPLVNEPTKLWKQRASLTYLNGTIFIPHGSVYESSAGFTGGIVAFDVASHSVSAYLPMTSGIWQAGAKCPTDGTYLYCITGNGAFDPANGFYGESFIKLQYVPARTTYKASCDPYWSKKQSESTGMTICADYVEGTTVAAALSIVDQWSPWTDRQRTGGVALAKGKIAGASQPSEEEKKTPVGGSMSMPLTGGKTVTRTDRLGRPVKLVYPPPMPNGAWSDEDWGSAGPACLFQLGVCIATGKDGIGYSIRTNALGGTTAATVGTVANYAKLAAPCQWVAVDPGNIPCDPRDPQALNMFPDGDTAHLHAEPTVYYDPTLRSEVMMVWAENQQGHLWKVNKDGSLTYLRQTNEYASPTVRGRSPGGMAGCQTAGSSNGQDPNTYLIVAVCPDGDANATITTASIYVYDPIHVALDGSVQLLWSSKQWGWHVIDGKFNRPLIWNGSIYYADYEGSVERWSQ